MKCLGVEGSANNLRYLYVGDLIQYDNNVGRERSRCQEKVCTCENGTGARGILCPSDGQAKCMTDGCDDGYSYSFGKSQHSQMLF